MQVLVDGDVVVYRAGFAAQKAQYTAYRFDEEFEEVIQGTFTYADELDEWINKQGLTRDDFIIERERIAEPVENALYNVRSIITRLLADVDADEGSLVLLLSGPDNFRNDVATIKKYKGNRDKAERPVHGPAIKEYMQSRYGAVFTSGEEADDQLGIRQYQMYKQDPLGSVIATIDKDLDMIPGLHFNFVAGETYYVDDETATRIFYEQLLCGDSTDNIPGIPGFGKKRSKAALADCNDEHEMFARCLELYTQNYDNPLDALIENARLVWIRREEGEMWSPPIKE